VIHIVTVNIFLMIQLCMKCILIKKVYKFVKNFIRILHITFGLDFIGLNILSLVGFSLDFRIKCLIQFHWGLRVFV